MQKRIFCLLWLSALLIVACDTANYPTAEAEPSVRPLWALAPENPDQKVYVTPETMEYHLANCPETLGLEKTVMLKSDAIAAGYTPNEHCFPPPFQPPEPHVYILPGDAVYYHINGCPDLTDDKILMLKSEAVEQGYTPDPDCAVPGRLHGAGNNIVFITVHGVEVSNIYHVEGGSHYLRAGWTNGTLTIVKKHEAEDDGFNPCQACESEDE